MRKTQALVTLAALSSFSLLLAGCAAEESATSADAAQSDPTTAAKLCWLTAESENDDSQTQGLLVEALDQAQSESPADLIHLASSSEPTGAIADLLAEDCTRIAGVGADFSEALATAATANPTVEFIAIGAEPVVPAVESAESGETGETPANLYSVPLQLDQASYLAGYAAAGMTATGTVGTFLGSMEPPTTAIADGFAAGVSAYNTAKGTAISVTGWDVAKQTGLMVDPAEGAAAGKQATEELFAAGADIVMPIAGAANLGALEASQAHEGTMVIWMGTDGAVTHPDYAAIILTSVVADPEPVLAALATEAPSEIPPADIASGAVSLAPWNSFSERVPAELTKEISQLTERIAQGDISVAEPVPTR